MRLKQTFLKKNLSLVVIGVMLSLVFLSTCSRISSTEPRDPPPASNFTVIAFNDLGMHCMNQDFSEFMILPPYNTLHAQVFDHSSDTSKIVTQGITVRYSIPGNTSSADKTNFWSFCQQLLGVSLAPDIGLAGKGLSGYMDTTKNRDWLAAGIPLTPLTDNNQTNSFQLGLVQVMDSTNTEIVRTQAVVPVSWELRCDLCHHGAPDAPVSVLDAHDRLHGTTLYNPGHQTPVLCGQCHAQPELGLAGQAGRNSLSRAMHMAHAPRMGDVVAMVPGGNACYACHPGVATQCLRDIHAMDGMTCVDCHAPAASGDYQIGMTAVADSTRTPWVTLPRCGDCHNNNGHEYEQPGVLFKNAKGHGGVFCETCHNSTHAVTPTINAADNTQSIALQNYAGPLKQCTLCHNSTPNGEFNHFYRPN